MENRLEDLKEIIDIQISEADIDEYNWGCANGLITAYNILINSDDIELVKLPKKFRGLNNTIDGE